MSKLFQYYGVHVKQGEYLFKEGDEADYMYLIHKGKVLINKMVKAVEEKIQVLEEGEFVGEMAIIDSMPRSANAVALEDCELIKMNKDSFENNIRNNPQMSFTFIQTLSKRIRDTNELVSELADKTRMLSFFNEIMKELLISGKRDSKGSYILLKMNEIIDMVMDRFDYTIEETMSIIGDMIEENYFKIKEDKNGINWLAYTLSE